MRKTKLSAIILLVVASMLCQIIPTWAADSVNIVDYDLSKITSATAYIYGTTYGTDAWSSSKTLKSYGRRNLNGPKRGYATLNFDQIADGNTFAAYGIKEEAAKNISAYENSASVIMNIADMVESTDTAGTVSTMNLYFAVMTEGANGEINFAGLPVTAFGEIDFENDTYTTQSFALSEFTKPANFLCSTGEGTSIDLTKFCGLGFVRMDVAEGETAPSSTGRICTAKLGIMGLPGITDLSAKVVDRKPVISFTKIDAEGLTYTVKITGNDKSERTETLTEADFDLEGGKLVWRDADAGGEVAYTYIIEVEHKGYGLKSASNEAVCAATPEDFGGEDMPEEAKSSVIAKVDAIRNHTVDKTWAVNAFGTKINGAAYEKAATSPSSAITDNILRVNMDYTNTYKDKDAALADSPPSWFVDYFAVGFIADKITGGPDGTLARCINIASAAETGKAVFTVYVEPTVDLTNAYFSIAQRWYGGSDIRLNFAGVPMGNYLSDADKGKFVTVAIPLADFKMGAGTYHKVWHYGYADWESEAPADKKDVELEYFTFMGVLRDCSLAVEKPATSGSIYIADMAICDIAPVNELEVIESSPNTIAIGWEHSATKAVNYNVYKEVDGEKVLVGQPTNNRYVNESAGLEVGETVTYSVAAVNEFGLESDYEEISVKIETIGKPRRFKVSNKYSDGNELAVNVSWGEPRYGDVKEYVLYRNGQKLNNPDINDGDTEFVDYDVVYGQEYSYQMCAVDVNGKESIKTEKITVTAAQVPDVENFKKTISGNKVTFSWTATKYAAEYELTVNGEETSVSGTQKTVEVEYNKEISASIKAINAGGGESCESKLAPFAIDKYTDTDYAEKLFTDAVDEGYKAEAGSMDVIFEETREKAIDGEKSMLCDFAKVTGGKLIATVLNREPSWDVEQYRKNNAMLTFWIYADDMNSYKNLEIVIQGQEDSKAKIPVRAYLPAQDYIKEAGKWVYVEVPFVDFPLKGAIGELEGDMNYASVKGIAFSYNTKNVTEGEKFYIDNIKVRTNPLWAAPTVADDLGNAVSGTISADAKAVVLSFAEPMDPTTLTTNNVTIKYAEGEKKDKVISTFVEYEDNKCTINLLQRLDPSTKYILNLNDVKSAKQVTSKFETSFTSNADAHTGELSTPPALAPTATGVNSGSTVTVTVSMPQAPVYKVGDYTITVSYDKNVLTPNGGTDTVLKALSGGTVTYGDGVITIIGNAGNKELTGALADIKFGVSTAGNTDINIGGSINAISENSEFAVEIKGKSTLSVTTGSAIGPGGGSAPSGGTADREDKTQKGNEVIDPTIVDNQPVTVGFTDINSVPWATEAISALVKEGIISGYPDNTVKPENVITREEFASLLVRVFSFKTETTESPFADVQKDAWYAKAIIVAHEKGIVSGVGADSFGIGSSITREDMCTMIYRAMQASRMSPDEKYDLYQFADDSEISQYAKDAVSALYKSGIISGVSNTAFAPKTVVNRAMAARVLYGVMGMM